MDVGVIFPQTEIGSDAGAVRDFAQGVEALGYHHLTTYDHVLGADPAVHPGWSGPYDVDSTFHEPFVLFGYLAALTRLELVCGIVILPQRQTVLVAKQAAEVDLLSEGGFRLGVGLGWNHVEYEGLGKSFGDRGARLTEQVSLLRRLWTERSVTFEGSDEHVRGAGIAPLPRQRPIPIWFGANSEPAWRRAGRLADGWFPQRGPGEGLETAKAVVDAAAREAGRDPATIGMEGRVRGELSDSDFVAQRLRAWQAAGATHVSINTMGAGYRDVEAHLEALASVASVSKRALQDEPNPG